jgi:hypothetical protein
MTFIDTPSDPRGCQDAREDLSKVILAIDDVSW